MWVARYARPSAVIEGLVVSEVFVSKVLVSEALIMLGDQVFGY